MSSQHTPGPWVPLFILDEQKISICNPETKEFVCRIKNEVSGRPIGEDDKANARLIAAAPELLEAAKAVLHWIPENIETLSGKPSSRDRLIAAIAKAEGRGE